MGRFDHLSLTMNKFARRSVAGFTLIEVMVSLIVFSAGLLGIIGLLVISVKANSSSYIKQQATQAANDIIDRMHSNSSQATLSPSGYVFSNLVTTGAPTLPSTPSVNCGTSTCTAAQMTTYDLWYWATNEVALLPNGCASITSSVSGLNTLITVTVQWDDTATEGKLGASTSASVTGHPNLAQISVQTLL